MEITGKITVVIFVKEFIITASKFFFFFFILTTSFCFTPEEKFLKQNTL
jgi:hypothetical protein